MLNLRTQLTSLMAPFANLCKLGNRFVETWKLVCGNLESGMCEPRTWFSGTRKLAVY